MLFPKEYKLERTGRGLEIRRMFPKVGRNEKCPCRSGLKYKVCCGTTPEHRKYLASRRHATS